MHEQPIHASCITQKCTDIYGIIFVTKAFLKKFFKDLADTDTDKNTQAGTSLKYSPILYKPRPAGNLQSLFLKSMCSQLHFGAILCKISRVKS